LAAVAGITDEVEFGTPADDPVIEAVAGDESAGNGVAAPEVETAATADGEA